MKTFNTVILAGIFATSLFASVSNADATSKTGLKPIVSAKKKVKNADGSTTISSPALQVGGKQFQIVTDSTEFVAGPGTIGITYSTKGVCELFGFRNTIESLFDFGDWFFKHLVAVIGEDGTFLGVTKDDRYVNEVTCY